MPGASLIFTSPASVEVCSKVKAIALERGYGVIEDFPKTFVAERNILADYSAARRADRIPWMATAVWTVLFLGGIIWFGTLVASSSAANPYPPSLVLVAGLFVLIFAAVSFANGWYWSDFIAVKRVEPTLPGDIVDGSPPLGPANSTVVVVGRAQTHDWEQRHSMGRNVLKVLVDPSLDDVRSEIESSLQEDRALT